MGLFNKLFTKSHEPYELKGRWYKMTISTGEDFGTVIKSDIPAYVPSPDPPSTSMFCYFINNRTLTIFGCFVSAVIAFPTENSDNASNPITFETKYSTVPDGKLKQTDVDLLGDGDFVYYLYGIK